MGKSFVFERPAAYIDADIIPSIKSIPESARKAIAATAKGGVTFRSHLCRFEVSKIGTCSVDNAWQPSEDDLAAEDWAIFEFLV